MNHSTATIRALGAAVGACLVVLLLAALGRRAGADEPAARRTARVGMNLAGPADYNSELPFVDVFRQARPWASQAPGKPWGQGPKLELDEHGWVKQLAAGCWAESPLCTLARGGYPGGQYTVLYEGRGTIEFSGAATVRSRQPGRITIDVDPSRGGFFLQLKSTEPSDYVRAIRVLMPGHEPSYRDEPWNPAFLRLWRGMACLRFMDFMHTNGSTVARWAERPTAADATWSRRGVPLEAMIDLANRLQADAWFCMPHRADDEYVRQFAALVRARLDPRRRAYVEYSNEVWNSIFEQHRYAADQGRRLGLGEKPWEAAWRYTAQRSQEMFAIWERELGKGRLVRVLAGQAANPYVAEQIVGFRDAAKGADALAIAPYLSLNVGPDTKPSASEVAGWSVEQLLDHVERQALPQSVHWMQSHRRLAERHGLRLVAYEGGQHFVGIQGAENNESLTRLLHAANAHPRLATIYQRYFDGWERAGGELFCYFSSVGQWSKWGSWGLLQRLDQDPAESPKFGAVMAWARSLGQPVAADR